MRVGLEISTARVGNVLVLYEWKWYHRMELEVLVGNGIWRSR